MRSRHLSAVVLALMLPVAASAAVSISINIAPPALPIYVQPAIPAAGYLWTPGYWRWNESAQDYFWVPGTWVAPPYVGALWTPGYWGWGGGGYAWHGGYWGTRIGFYGGINYGFGYVGHGYAGGYWNGGVFNYNRSVNNVNTTIVHNVYNTTVVENRTHVSFNGGEGGIAARPSADERQMHGEQRTPPTAVQRQHEQVAMRAPEQRASVNHGTPAFAATAHAGDIHGGVHGEGVRAGEAPSGREAMQHAPGPERAPERGQDHPPERHGERAPDHRGEHREGGRER